LEGKEKEERPMQSELLRETWPLIWKRAVVVFHGWRIKLCEFMLYGSR
jgi:hypothetical protein